MILASLAIVESINRKSTHQLMLRLITMALLLGLAFFPLVATAAPFQLDLDADVLVEGSTRRGGMQPDYLISPKDPALIGLFQHAKAIGRSKLGYWEKVAEVRDLVASALPLGDYDEPVYLKLMKRYRQLKEPIPLGAYFKVGAGVCREHYLGLHLGLRHAGIDNDAVYAQVAYGLRDKSIEDHGLVVLKGAGRGVTVDSYHDLFDGLHLETLLSKEGVRHSTPVAPSVRRRKEGRRRVVRVHGFPHIRPLRPGQSHK